MNKLKKGPEIKLSDLKVPDFVYDLYYDLRERHLLPLVVLLLVAIVAVPIVASQSSSESTEPGAEDAIAGASAAPSQSGVLVAKSAPALRDYRRRLERLQAKDPFQQQYRGDEESAGTGSSSTTSSEGASGASSSTPETFAPPTTTEQSETGGEPAPGEGELTYFSYAIDVRVVPGGSQDGGATPKSAGEASVRRNLPELTMLPSRETPAVVYMGSTKDGKKALMLVSSNVEAIFGDGKCMLGSDSCQLLAMEPGVPQTFVYGGKGRTFKIELLKVHLVTTDKLNRAPLGKPKKAKKNQGGRFRQQ